MAVTWKKLAFAADVAQLATDNAFTADQTIASGKFLTALTDGNTGGLRAGSGSDVLLYRGAANQWRTPDAILSDTTISATGEMYPGGDAAGIVRRDIYGMAKTVGTVTEDFNPTSLGANWSWAGAPFITPDGGAAGLWGRPSAISISHNSGAAFRAFLYRNTGATLTAMQMARFCMITNTTGQYIGLRIDDGTDNNYSEVALRYVAANSYDIIITKRSGGGAVTTTVQFVLGPLPMWVILDAYPVITTQWTNWTAWGDFAIDSFGIFALTSGVMAAAAWTPTRIGITFNAAVGSGNWQAGVCDWWDQ